MAQSSKKKTTKKTTSADKSKVTKSKSRDLKQVSSAPETPKTSSIRSLKVKRSYVAVVLGILILVTIVYLGRNLIVAAMVNGQPISRLSVVRELESQGGKQALDSLITKQLILQEARKKNVAVSSSDVDAEMKKISDNLAQQGQKLDQVLSLQGMTRDQLVEQIKLQKMLEKMVGKIEVTEKEVDDYITNNQESLPTDQDEASIAANVKTSLTQQKLNEKAQSMLEALRKNANINYFVQY